MGSSSHSFRRLGSLERPFGQGPVGSYAFLKSMFKITYCGLSAARRFQKFRKQSQARIHVQQRRSTVSFNLSARFPRLIMFRSLSPLLRWLSFFPNHESASCFCLFFFLTFTLSSFYFPLLFSFFPFPFSPFPFPSLALSLALSFSLSFSFPFLPPFPFPPSPLSARTQRIPFHCCPTKTVVLRLTFL